MEFNIITSPPYGSAYVFIASAKLHTIKDIDFKIRSSEENIQPLFI